MSVVYFIRPANAEGPVKVGVTRWNADRRLAVIQAYSPVQLELIATTPGTRSLERLIHWHLLDTHSHAEWFHWTPKMARLIEAVKDGSFAIRDFEPVRTRGTRLGMAFRPLEQVAA